MTALEVVRNRPWPGPDTGGQERKPVALACRDTGELVWGGIEQWDPTQHSGFEHGAHSYRRRTLLDPGDEGRCDPQAIGELGSGPACFSARDRNLRAERLQRGIDRWKDTPRRTHDRPPMNRS
jgi:hypothetical protein